MLSNPGALLLLRTSTEFLITLYTGGLFELNVEINGKTLCLFFFWFPKFILRYFWGFIDSLYFIGGVVTFF